MATDLVTLKYDYTTRNFHKYSGKGQAINEIYVMRASMPQPQAEVQVTVNWDSTKAPVAERLKPMKV